MLERGLALLNAIANHEEGALTISELASEIGTSRATVYRLLGPLQDEGFVRRDGSGVRLGLGLMRLASKVLPHLRAVTTPTLRNLAERVGATAHLTVADGSEAQAVVVVEPSQTTFHVAYRVGSRHPLDRGAAGHAMSLPPGGQPWATSAGELEPGAYGVAAPVHGVASLRASVGVIALSPFDTEVIGPLVLHAAAEISTALN
jgi:DNA-binding IclR family transcriptional regulator